MNIVKLKDVIMPKEFGMSDFFNKNLKGRYAYWIQMRYIFPLESLCYGEYIRLEQSEPIDFLSDKMPQHIDLYSEEYCMIDFVKEFVDLCATEEANNVYNYIASNEYVTDADIDMSKIRIFRTWLAKEILALDKDMYDEHMGKLTTEQIYMLEFYRNGMYNDVLKQLELFGSSNAKMNTITNTSSCGCCNNTISLYDLSSIDSCNATAIYVSNIHKIMVETFEQPSFWINLNVDFIRVFKKYIDNIIAVGLTINDNNNNTSLKFVDCPCTNKNSSNTESILRNLSTSLGYIIDRSHLGHMNFIHDSLYKWAEYLYDYMYWEVK